METKAEYQKRKRLQRRAMGLCMHCYTPALPGLSKCQKHSPSTAEYQKQKVAERRAKGLCTHCSQPAMPDRAFCQKHLENRREYSRKTTKIKIQNGRCHRCNGARAAGKAFCKDCLVIIGEKDTTKRAFRRANSLCCTCGTWVKNRAYCATCLGRATARRRKLKVEVFNAYGGARCECCGITEVDFLTIEHPDNDGAEHRKSLGNIGGFTFYRRIKKMGFPKTPRMVVVCFNCNCARAFFGLCPHERMRCEAVSAATEPDIGGGI